MGVNVGRIVTMGRSSAAIHDRRTAMKYMSQYGKLNLGAG